MKQPEYSAPAVAKVIDIFELMASKNKSMTITEISVCLNISVNSTFRILKELELKKYVQKDPSNASYSLTSKLYYLGSSIGNRITLKSTASVAMNRLAEETKETTILTTFSPDFQTLIIDQIESPEPLKFVSVIGYKYPSHSSAMGKAMLAYLDDNQFKRFLESNVLEAFTDKTITNLEKLKSELLSIKENGYSIDNEESCIGIRCIAVPVVNINREVKGAIGVSGPLFRINKNFDRFLSSVRDAGASISELLGFKLNG